MMPADVTAVSMNSAEIMHEIEMMVRQLREAGVNVQSQSATCITVAGEHHDFGSVKQTHAYLSGCHTFLHSRPFESDPTDTEASP